MLSRKIITRSGRRFRGKFPSTKLGRMVAWESLLERDAILLMELSPGILSYQEQPAIIEYFDGTRICKYFPDFELVTRDGSHTHLEVKPSAELLKPEIRSKYACIAEQYQANQHDFRIATEIEIRREPLFSNLESLAYFHQHPGHLLPTTKELDEFFQGEEKLLDECDRVLGIASTRRLIAIGRLICDLDLPLTAGTSVYLFKGEQNATILL